MDLIDGRQKGLWSLFEHTLAVSWIFPAKDPEARGRVLGDIGRIKALLPDLEAQERGSGIRLVWHAHEGVIMGGEAAAAGWRVLLSDALLRWQENLAPSREDRS